MVKKRIRNKPKNVPNKLKKKGISKRKPIDSWLAIGGIVVTMFLTLAPKTPYVIITLLILIFILMLHPIWKFWWIERSIWRRMAALLILCIGLLTFGAYIWPNYVLVNPDKLDLSSSGWVTLQNIEINNQKLSSIYSVWIKATSISGDFDIDDIQIESKPNEESFSQSIGEINVNYQILIFRGLDANNKPCIYFLIAKIKPIASEFIQIRKKRPNLSKNDLHLLLKLVRYSDKPPRMASKADAAALQFNPPESLTIKSISVFLKRKE